MSFRTLKIVCTVALAAAIPGVHADALLPLSNESALARSFALPELGTASILPAGSNELRFSLDWTNEFVDQRIGDESLILDGETQRYAWNWRHGFGHGLEAGLQLPFYVNNGGVLDGLIQGYHSTFGFPNGGRDDRPSNQYLYQYQRNGQSVLDIDRSANEFGDVELAGGWQALPSLALRAMVKLPTGHSDHLTGGNAGTAAWLDYDPFTGARRWLGFLSAGGSLNAKGDVIPEQQHHLVGFAGAGLGYRLWQPFALMAQFYAHTPLYDDSQTTPLRRDGLQLGFGGRYDFNPHLALNAGFQEDLVTDSSPDFSIHLSIIAR